MKLSELKAFEGRLGHSFARPDLLIEAVTHASMSSPTRNDEPEAGIPWRPGSGPGHGRGPAGRDRSAAEGQLAPRFNALVRKEACAEVAREIGLASGTQAGPVRDDLRGAPQAALLGDAMEAVIAAVYLDAGFSAARDTVLDLWGTRIGTVSAMPVTPRRRFRNGRRPAEWRPRNTLRRRAAAPITPRVSPSRRGCPTAPRRLRPLDRNGRPNRPPPGLYWPGSRRVSGGWKPKEELRFRALQTFLPGGRFPTPDRAPPP